MLPNINSLRKQFILFAIEPSIRMILGVGGQPSIHNWNHTTVCCVSQCLNSKFHFEIHLNQLVKISKQKTSIYCIHERAVQKYISKPYSIFLISNEK